ncbi:MAG TPA: hypothetical protein VEQ40_04930, partial [Pyrinomonadaceae bacterium]|nr:hypothetical protein [Pyrinomonadaceae bacterium]
MTDALNRHGVVTLEDLRRCISKDVNAGINWTVINTGASHPLLTALLIAEAREDASPSGKRKLLRYWRALKTLPAVFMLSAVELRELWRNKGAVVIMHLPTASMVVLRQSLIRPRHLLHNWRRHWFDASVAATVLLFVASLLVGARQINRQQTERVAVKQTVALPAFHRINEEVEMKSAPGASSAFNTTDEVRDRYTLSPVLAGAVLRRDQLLSAELSQKMQGRRILSVPLKAGNYSPALAPPTEALMILSTREAEMKTSEPVIMDVIV